MDEFVGEHVNRLGKSPVSSEEALFWNVHEIGMVQIKSKGRDDKRMLLLLKMAPQAPTLRKAASVGSI
jgi:hypothetical protein